MSVQPKQEIYDGANCQDCPWTGKTAIAARRHVASHAHDVRFTMLRETVYLVETINCQGAFKKPNAEFHWRWCKHPKD